MFRRLTASLAAAALALTAAFSTPAAAMSDKDRQLLTVLLGAAVVGAIIHDANKDRKKPAPVTRRHDDHFRFNDWNDRDWRGQGWRGNRWGQRTIPAGCVISIRGAGGRREVVSARCLKDAGLRRDLPAECAFDIEAGWGSRRVYGTRCLRQNGFRIAGTR